MVERPGTKYGTAFAAKIYVCPDNHIHVLGKDHDGVVEYEIVLGKRQFPDLDKALDEVREK